LILAKIVVDKTMRVTIVHNVKTRQTSGYIFELTLERVLPRFHFDHRGE